MTQSCRADTSVAKRKSFETPSARRPLSRSLGSRFARSIVVLFAMLLIAANADAIVIDFSVGTVGDLETSSVNIGGIVVDGFYFDGSWLSANLFRRNEPNDHGLGICNPDETCTFPGGGNINELDNNGHPELIRLTLPDGFFWTEVGISSMDENGSDDEEDFERGEAYATNDGDPANLLSGSPFWQFEGTVPVEVTHPVTGADQFAQHIFFRPFDWSGGAVYGYNTDNDFLVWQATIEPIPEPGTLGLLAAGLLGLGIAARRRKS